MADALAIYLNDHLAGSSTALSLLDHLIETAPTAQSGRALTTLRDDILADRAVLEHIIRKLENSPSIVREAGGWIAGILSRLKLIFDDPTDGSLRRFEALELLSLGILGKRSLWRALSSVAPLVPPLAAVDLAALIQRAEDQYQRAEAERLEAGRGALGVA